MLPNASECLLRTMLWRNGGHVWRSGGLPKGNAAHTQWEGSASIFEKWRFLLWVKIIKFDLKWVKMGPLRLRIYFLGYFDMGISVLILPDSLDSVFGSFLRISWPNFFQKSPILPLYRALLTPWKGPCWSLERVCSGVLRCRNNSET